jgi:hypothetical protein
MEKEATRKTVKGKDRKRKKWRNYRKEMKSTNSYIVSVTALFRNPSL